jgi:hypothetical protein
MFTQARPVIRVSDLFRFTGLKRSQIEELIKRKILRPFVPPGGRVRMVFEEDVARLQQAMVADATTKTETAVEPEPNRRRRLAREAAEQIETNA